MPIINERNPHILCTLQSGATEKTELRSGSRISVLGIAINPAQPLSTPVAEIGIPS
jgi:hypothetical protein